MPQVTARELGRFLQQQGFAELRQSGSHLTMKNRDTGVSVTIPMHRGNDLGRGLAQAILRQAGFSVDDYLHRR